MVLLFEDADDEQIAFALLSLGIARGRLERPIEAITPLDDLLRRFGESVRPELQIWMASALRNKGVALGMLDRQVEEIAAYDEVLCRYGASDSSALQERVANAMFSLTCVHARRSAVPECIAALLRWRERRGSLDREKIASDTDFDGVRSHPDFVAFLSENGCPPSPPQPNAHSVAKKP